MRVNLPVTQKTYDFPFDQTLISVTDVKGRIIYANSNFIAVSGFTREELLGQPHNIVRHPDMPEEAFRDMWQTILHEGRPWTGLVATSMEEINGIAQETARLADQGVALARQTLELARAGCRAQGPAVGCFQGGLGACRHGRRLGNVLITLRSAYPQPHPTNVAS